MKRLSISQARDLIKRELGLSAASLTAPPEMNGHPDFPWYTMYAGTQRIELYSTDVTPDTGKMVALRVTRENSSKGTTEYFFGDTLEYAEGYTEWQNREIFCESMEDPDDDLPLRRLKREAQDESWEHFHGQSRQNIQTTKTDNIPGKLSEKQELEHQQIMEQAAWDNFQGKLLRGHDLFKIRVCDLQGKPYSEAGPFDETQMKWWMNEVTRGVNNNPETTSGWLMFQWDRKQQDWRPFSMDGQKQLCYDTGRRPDGIHEKCITIPPMLVKETSNPRSTNECILEEESPEMEM
jgi:hypothetical protein